MRFLTVLPILASAVAACGPDDAPEPAADDDFVPPQVIDTGWPAGDLGIVQLVHSLNRDRTTIYAVFADSAPSFPNLAECAIEGTLCLTGFPSDEDDWEEIDPDEDVERETIATRYAGYEISLGDFVLEYREDPETWFGFYELDISDQELPEGWLGAKFGGQFEAFETDRAMYVPPPIELQKPTVDSHIVFTNNEWVPFEWVPTGEGFVTLAVFTRFTLARHYLLEDDGYFELEVDSLGLTGNTEDVTFLFTRWYRNDVSHKGHTLKFLSSSTAAFTGEYVLVGDRVYTPAPDECTEAEGRAALQAGGWWGFLDGPVNQDYSAPFGCLNGPNADSRGRDGVFRLDVLPKHSIGIEYNTYEQSPSIYLVSDCNDVTGTCFRGNDVSPDINIPEYVQFFNPDDELRSVYVVIDTTTATDGGATVWTLDVTDTELLPPDMYDTCVEAQDALGRQETLPAGSYYADYTSFTDGLNPGAGGCTGTSLPGPDSMVPITLPPNGVLTASINMPGGDPALYLLYNCENEFQCAAGADQSIGPVEELYYQSQNGSASENVYLVVDTKSALRAYFLGIQIQ